MPEKILLVDDTPANMSVLLDLLEPRGYTVSAAPNGVVALNVVSRLMPDLILLDVMMPELDGLETCRRLKTNPATARIPVLFISARDDAASILQGFQAGGSDYIVKPFQPEEVLARVEAHLRLAALSRQMEEKNAQLLRANQELEREIGRRRQTEEALSSADARLVHLADQEERKWGIEQFVGRSPLLMKILESIRRLRNFSSVNVLITGESGTGKELVARAIHHGSGKRGGPFIPVNCVAIPEELAESMLFGHLKGSFTGATMDRKGFFELAHGGTLFLDEIGDMSPSLQAKLLRVLEDGQITPIGATAARRVEVRVVAATNADLSHEIRIGGGGKFRRDLYFRLAQFTVEVPPLRERMPDVPLLAEHFLRVFAAEMGVKAPRLLAEAQQTLMEYGFPGNIRELKNIVERALIESNGEPIDVHHLHLTERLWGTDDAPVDVDAAGRAGTAPGPAMAEDLPLNLEKAEAMLIQRALAQTGGNVARAARLLGINRTRIYRKFQETSPPVEEESKT